MVNRSLPHLEGAGPLSRPSLPGPYLRWAWQRSVEPTSDPEAYADREFAVDALAVMDATATQQAVLVSLSAGAYWALLLAAEHPERVAGAVFIGPALPLGPSHPQRMISFNDVLDADEGWAKYNRHYWLKDYRGFLEFFMSQIFTEPHSTKQIEDAVGWGLETTLQGLPAIAIALCYCGPLEEGERLVEPVRKFGPPLADQIGPMGYFDLNSMLDAAFPAGRCCYEKASAFKALSDEAIETIADYGAAFTSPFSAVLIQHVHGAASRVGQSEAAFAQREESYVMNMIALWDEGEANAHIEWVRTFWTAMEPFAASGVYVNYLGNEGKGGYELRTGPTTRGW